MNLSRDEFGENMKIKAYIQLIRPKHYLKNVLIFLPLVFGGHLFEKDYLVPTLQAFVIFSLVASGIYIVNDLKDRKLDALHPKKKNRPIASGAVGVGSAVVLAGALFFIAGLLQYKADFSAASTIILVSYVAINIAYSFGLKNVPIVDVLILSLGFVLRVVYGGYAADIEVSKWLYLAVMAFSFYLGLGKRRNEIRTVGHEARKVNKHYNQDFLDKNMYVCLGLGIAYYSLWAVDPIQQHKQVFWTIPLVIAIVMAYSLAVESAESDGDPVSVLTTNWHILVLVAIYGLLMTGVVYI